MMYILSTHCQQLTLSVAAATVSVNMLTLRVATAPLIVAFTISGVTTLIIIGLFSRSAKSEKAVIVFYFEALLDVK